MPALPVRRLVISALCSSLLIGGAAPAFASDSADESTRRTFVSSDPAADPDPGAVLQQLAPLGGLTGILAPINGLLAGLLAAPQGKTTAQDTQDAQKHVDTIEAALPKTPRDGQTEAMAELQSAIDDLVKTAESGGTTTMTPRLSKAVSGLVTSLTSQWLEGATKP
ncbi:hypothetical protein ACIREE_41385 [Streptomyces sp. NPDC102467]|uniref:hypothetical protein n=1 Tax=Streptomyces sp. NPDC102467 TaxID=3366179 RepID=UPI0038223D65